MLTSQQFDRSRNLALQLAGIELFARHRELLERRIRRLGLDHTAVERLFTATERNDSQAKEQFIGLVTTNFTGFFRHPRHFEVAAERARLAVQRHGQARCWSVAAATGEEPYSVAMALIEAFGRPDPPALILASDIDQQSLAAAGRGEFSEQALRAVDPARRARFFS